MACSTKEPRMTVAGECTPAWEGEKIYLEAGRDFKDSCTIKNGKFKFDLSNLKEPGEAVVSRFNKKEQRRESTLLYLDYCDTYMKLSGAIYTTYDTNFIKGEVTGNPTNTAVWEVNDVFLGEHERTEAWIAVMDSILIDRLVTVAQGHDRASVYALCKYGVYMTYYDRLIPAAKDCLENLPLNLTTWKPAMELKQIYDQYATVAIGAIAPDFTLNTPEGNPVSLHEFVKGKKLVLINFWASWHDPYWDLVKEIYDKYHNKGLDILAVSLDNDKEAWKKAIRDNNLSWTHVSDLKHWDSIVKELYHFSGIPTLYLVDGEGKIVARNLRENNLEREIAQHLK